MISCKKLTQLLAENPTERAWMVTLAVLCALPA